MTRPPLVPVLVFALGCVAIAASAWAASRGAPRAQPVAENVRKAVTEAVYGYAELAAHLHGSGGDPRFAERLPADPEVVSDVLGDIEFATHAGRIEEPRLFRAEFRDVHPAGFDTYDVDVKEYWVTRTISAGGAILGTRSDVVLVRYVVRRGPGGWKVVAWDVAESAGGP
jgi:hypothetical protein